MNAPKRTRGRPPRIARDVAVLLAVQWHERAEGHRTTAATEAVRALWHSNGYRGLGDPARPSRAVFACMRRAAAFLGEGRTVVLDGIEVGGRVHGAAATFVPDGSELRYVRGSRRQAIFGPHWHWSFASPEAEFFDGGVNESPSVGGGRVGAPPCASLGQGPGMDSSVPEPRTA